MIGRFTAVFVASILALVAVASEAPTCLIIQRMSEDSEYSNLSVGQFLAEQLDVEGRVKPMLWSITDPDFRKAIDDGVLPSFKENPDDQTIRDYARKLRVNYVLVIEALTLDGNVFPQAQLYRGSSSRSMWAMLNKNDRGQPDLVVTRDGKVDEEQTKAIRAQHAGTLSGNNINTFIVMVDGKPDWVYTARSLASTWQSLLAAGPFKNYQPARRQFDPEPDPGQGFEEGPGTVVQAAPEVKEAILRANQLAADGYPDMAILVLRDSIDANPFEASTRLLLSQLFMQRGHAKLAAEEAERAAKITEGSSELWAIAAEAWLQAGDIDKAVLAANESLARGNTNLGLTLTLADIWLQKRDTETSLKNYDSVIASQPSSRAYIGRSLVRAIAGDVQGSTDDLELAQGGASLPQDLYMRSMLVIEAEIEHIAEELRDIPKAVRTKSDPNIVARTEAVLSETQAIVEFMVRVRVLAQFKISHEQRDLAHKLLAQSAYEALAFAKSGNDDSAMESAISLGEALRLLPQIRVQFQAERK